MLLENSPGERIPFPESDPLVPEFPEGDLDGMGGKGKPRIRHGSLETTMFRGFREETGVSQIRWEAFVELGLGLASCIGGKR